MILTKPIVGLKLLFYNTMNDTLRNSNLSAKTKFSILLKLMKNNKFSNLPTIVENNITVQDPLNQSNIFNKHFAAKSSVHNSDDPVPNLPRREGVNDLSAINTSPLEIGKIIRNIKISHFSNCGIPGKFIHLILTPVSISMSRLLINLFEIG